MNKRVLLAGESWTSQTTHVKGFDAFYSSVYETGSKWLIGSLKKGGYEVDFMPNHLINEEFPFTMEGLNKWDCIILSDVGANTFEIPNITFTQSVRKPNRCKLLKEYVLQGGSLIMVGGYLTFSGVDAKGRWGVNPVQDILPVKVLTIDDRREHCEGVAPKVVKDHAILKGLSKDWPCLLGYNKTEPLPDSETLVEIDGDPLISIIEKGKGKSAVFTSDCAPHWCPPEFLEWKGYTLMWCNLMDWLTK